MSETIRVATWNMKQAVAPKKPLDQLWKWMEEEINPDVIVLTEAKVPKAGLPDGWSAIWTPDGIGERRRWGTIVAARQPFTVEATDFPRNIADVDDFELPMKATVHTVDVKVDDTYLATVVGAYGFLHDGESGIAALGHIADEACDALASGRENLIVAGDFNLWPNYVLPVFIDELEMIDVWSHVPDLLPLEGGVGGSRVWTHKNGNSPNAARQEIDFIFLSEVFSESIDSICGGVEDFPDAWDMSDHAPVAIDIVL